MTGSIFDFFEQENLGELAELPVNQLEASRFQPRIHPDETAMQELTDSIRINGLLSPITVRKRDDHYEIISGERRWRACQRAGYDTILCRVLSPNDAAFARRELIERLQKDDLTAVEEARSYVQVMRLLGITQEELARKIRRSQSAVANKIRLLNLPQEVQNAVSERRISERHARALLLLSRDRTLQACRNIEENSLSVRETEAYVRQLTGRQTQRRKQKTKGFTRNTQIGVNSVNQCVAMIRKMGIDVVMDTEETDQELRILLKFPK
ncbi:MAG: ParB/RepB/Spo0J family partition protein [Solobacterium sp.]|nr:ParB/RepB/Spo0J family partition protein [Solobacterium sp.]